MTLNTTYKPAVAEGNGIIKEFSYSFNPLSLSYIKVYFEVDGKWVEQKTGWSATVSDSGGVVTFLNAPTTRVSIERDIPESQPTSYTTSSGFQAKVIENSFDLLTGMVQELKDASDRSVKVEVGDNQTPEELLQTVYDKLDSATEIAGDAISAANQAQAAADNATAAVNSAEQTLVQTQAYVDSAKVEIDNTKSTAIETINSTVSTAKADINASVDEATTNISDIVSNAEGSITNIAVTEANKAIANAAQEATDIATANLNSYVDGTIKPSLQTYVDQAQEDANSAANSMEQAALSATAASNYASNASNYASNASASETNALSSKNAAASSATAASGSANNAKIWAEGTDSQVQALGGTKSAKGWAEASTNLDYTNISNCITEIPQDIKLELKDGTLTLKAGSKVYVPNGKNADGSLRFDEVVVNSDLSRATFAGVAGSKLMFAIVGNRKLTALSSADIAMCTSGTTSPTAGIFYNTNTNYIYNFNNSSVVDQRIFPVAVVTQDANNVITSIDQVFNGFGYIGSTIFALPGVKGLIPNGRNADGSLKNIEFTTQSVLTQTGGVSGENKPLVLRGNDFSNYATADYNEELNLNIGGTGTNINRAIVGTWSATNSVITSFTPKTAFHAVDYNDFESTIANYQQPITAITATSGTVSLAIGKIYTLSVTGSTTFSLPTPSNTTVFNQIKVMMKVTGTPTITWGTTNFFNKSTPEIKAGSYDVYFDWDNNLSAWVCGAMAKGTAS